VSERITGIMAGSAVPLSAEAPELAGADQGWSGFLTEAHVMGPRRDEVGWTWRNTHVGVCTWGSGDIEVSTGGRDIRYRAGPGNVTIFPSGFGPATIRQFDGRCRFLAVELDLDRLFKLFPDVGHARSWRFAPLIDGSDPQIVALLGNMHAEIAAGCPSGALYADTLSLALAAYLSGRYGARSLAGSPLDEGLSRRQRARTLDYMHAHYGRDLRLAELAAAIGVSPRHLLRQFRKTFRTTPHRYLTELRVSRGERLLAETRMPVAEVALALGFNSQSHFTDVFRRETGTTPARYRQEH
jgi:AraC family transcriptional regulator